MIYQINHATPYPYVSGGLISHNLAHLAARNYARQTCRRHEIWLSIPPAVLTEQTDDFGNPATFFIVQEPHRELRIRASNEVWVHPRLAPSAWLTMPCNHVRDTLRTSRDAATMDAYLFTFESAYIPWEPALADYAKESFPHGRPVLEGGVELMGRLHDDFTFDPTLTTIATPLGDVMAFRRGVCQDFAHLEIGCLRSLGLAARYVSGYSSTTPPVSQQRMIDAGASHAWVSVYCSWRGWTDVDPTNNVIPCHEHIVLVLGRDFDDVSPIKGVILGGGGHNLSVAVDVVRLDEGYDDVQSG